MRRGMYWMLVAILSALLPQHYTIHQQILLWINDLRDQQRSESSLGARAWVFQVIECKDPSKGEPIEGLTPAILLAWSLQTLTALYTPSPPSRLNLGPAPAPILEVRDAQEAHRTSARRKTTHSRACPRAFVSSSSRLIEVASSPLRAGPSSLDSERFQCKQMGARSVISGRFGNGDLVQ